MRSARHLQAWVHADIWCPMTLQYQSCDKSETHSCAQLHRILPDRVKLDCVGLHLCHLGTNCAQSVATIIVSCWGRHQGVPSQHFTLSVGLALPAFAGCFTLPHSLVLALLPPVQHCKHLSQLCRVPSLRVAGAGALGGAGFETDVVEPCGWCLCL